MALHWSRSHALLWNQDNQQNSEVIFAIQYSTDLILNGGTGNLPGYVSPTLATAGNRGHLYFGMEYDIQPGMIRDIANGRPFKRFRPTDYMIDQWAASIVRMISVMRIPTNMFGIAMTTRTSGNGIPLWKQVHVDKGAKKADGSLVTAADIGKRRFAVGDTALYVPGPGQDGKVACG